MKLIPLILLLLTATNLLAENTVALINIDIPEESKAIVLENIREAGGDVAVIDYDSLGTYRNKANTNLLYKACGITTDSRGMKEWKSMPVPQFETRITKDVRPPDKQKILARSHADFMADYEPVQTELP